MKQSFMFILAGLMLTISSWSWAQDTLRMEGLNYKDGQGISVVVLGDRIIGVDTIPTELLKEKLYIAPGLVDMQINGFAGIDFSDQNLTVEMMQAATRALWKTGVTTFLPTVITHKQESLLKSFSLLAAARQNEEIGKSIPGFHLEGPYISPLPGFRGAHLEKYIRPPDWEELTAMQKAAQNGIMMITLAPEAEGALPFIGKCKEAGMLVSLGHHNGDALTIGKAVEAGASLSTHLGNGCANMINRHHNPIWPQLANDGLTITLIADGYHLTREEVISFYGVKGAERTVLVSDALDLAGLPPGEYIRGERKVLLTEGVVKYPEEDVLAGAASPISAHISNIMAYTGCSQEEAIQMASTHPARLLGLNDIGEIMRGNRADLIFYSLDHGKMTIHSTILAGKVVYSRTPGNLKSEPTQ